MFIFVPVSGVAATNRHLKRCVYRKNTRNSVYIKGEVRVLCLRYCVYHMFCASKKNPFINLTKRNKKKYIISNKDI